MNCPEAICPSWDDPQLLNNQEPDEILHNFLQEMVELDRQPAVESPTATKRQLEEPTTPSPTQHQTMEGRKRHKQELQTLKSEAETLENYVQFLKRGHQNQVGLSTQRSLQETQERNSQLKDQVHSCVHISDALQTVLSAAERLRNEQLNRNSIASRALRVEMRLSQQQQWADATTAGVFDLLEASVIARVGKMKSLVAAEMSHPVLKTDNEEIQICRKDESRPTVEFRSTRVLPFNVETVSHVCWHGCAMSRAGGVRVAMRSEGVVSTDMSMPVPLESGEVVEIRVLCVIKRFILDGSFVVIAESLTEWPAHLVASGAWSKATRESGWGIVHRYPTPSQRSTTSASVSRFLLHMSCMPTGTDVEGARKLLNSPAVSNVVIPSFRRLIHNRQQNVDNLLLDMSLNQQCQ
ncbi:hypothetical protein PHYBOEH_005994 [Phytophthora boehmeriae]|uniref:M96 mating-specific protein family n=1 Tax=Phytophthora boehmeriae TaxID=109152 RepID=A0A8T1WKV5_9STRA|nr:hypothetical protein PHYBOEH_005994 [Phytophthora boehmeriae]